MEKGIGIGMEKGIGIGMEKGIGIGVEKGIGIGMEKGIVKGHADDLRKLMKAFNLTMEQAMAVLEIPAAERPQIMELLEQ